jgi:hypothetical protein
MGKGRRVVLRAVTVLVSAILAIPAFAGTASAACDGYTYAGLMSVTPQAGVSATITALDAPSVRGGHVAAWVGVGGEGLGPGTSDEWFQAGLVVVEGDDLAAYYEIVTPGSEPRQVVVRRSLAVGRSYRVAIRESRFRPEWWAAWLDRTRVSPWIHLPASHGAWRAVATAEGLDDGDRACNGFAFRFSNVLTRPSWAIEWSAIDGIELTSFRGRVANRDESGFVAAGGSSPRTPTAGR